MQSIDSRILETFLRQRIHQHVRLTDSRRVRVQYLTESAWHAHETGFKARHESREQVTRPSLELTVATNYPSTWLVIHE